MRLCLLIVMFAVSFLPAQENKLKWGILSTARINGPIIDAIRKSDNSMLVAVASRSLDKAQKYADERAIPKAYGSYEQLLADSEVDVVYISLPNSMHAQWSIKALNAGKHVLCEKPFVLTTEEMDAVEQAAQVNNKIIFEAFGYMHHPQTQKVLALVKEGKLGQVHYMHGWFSYVLPPEFLHNYRLNKDLGGGSLWDIGCYPISLAIAIANDQKPESITGKIIYDKSGIDTWATSQLHFAHNFTAHIFCSFRAPFQEKFILVGTEGILETNHAWRIGAKTSPTELLFTGLDGNQEIITIEPRHRYLDEVEAMEHCVMSQSKPVVSLALSRSVVATISTLLASAQE